MNWTLMSEWMWWRCEVSQSTAHRRASKQSAITSYLKPLWKYNLRKVLNISNPKAATSCNPINRVWTSLNLEHFIELSWKLLRHATLASTWIVRLFVFGCDLLDWIHGGETLIHIWWLTLNYDIPLAIAIALLSYSIGLQADDRQFKNPFLMCVDERVPRVTSCVTSRHITWHETSSFRSKSIINHLKAQRVAFDDAFIRLVRLVILLTLLTTHHSAFSLCIYL